MWRVFFWENTVVFIFCKFQYANCHDGLHRSRSGLLSFQLFSLFLHESPNPLWFQRSISLLPWSMFLSLFLQSNADIGCSAFIQVLLPFVLQQHILIFTVFSDGISLGHTIIINMLDNYMSQTLVKTNRKQDGLVSKTINKQKAGVY